MIVLFILVLLLICIIVYISVKYMSKSTNVADIIHNILINNHITDERQKMIDNYINYYGNDAKPQHRTTDDPDYFNIYGYMGFTYASQTNPHSLGAFFRQYYEYKNILDFAISKHTLLHHIIDVGASRRLGQNGIAVILLNPILNITDTIRNFYQHNIQKTMSNYQPTIYDQTLMKFMYHLRQKYDIIYNLTDVIYYLSEKDIIRMSETSTNNIFAMGTMHLFTGEHELHGTKYTFGTVKKHWLTGKITMQVNGNADVYTHYPVFNQLLQQNTLRITKNIYITVLNRNSFGATEYVRFAIIKTPQKFDILKSSLGFDYSRAHTVKQKYLRNKEINELLGKNEGYLHSHYAGKFNIEIIKTILIEMYKIDNEKELHYTTSRLLSIHKDLVFTDIPRYLQAAKDVQNFLSLKVITKVRTKSNEGFSYILSFTLVLLSCILVRRLKY